MISRGNIEALHKPPAPSQEEGKPRMLKPPENFTGGESLVKKGGSAETGEAPKKTIEELRAALDTARDNLARKKGDLKEFEKLFVGVLKGIVHGKEKANIQKEYDDVLKKYQEARAQYVVGDVSKLTEERMTLAEALVEAKKEGSKEHFLYKGYKWLGEQNVAKLFGEKFGWKLSDEFQKDHPLASGALRIAGKFLSVRTAISMGLLGAGLMTGVGSGLALGMGILGGRALMRGIGTASASHDMLKLIGATTWESKGTLKYKKEEPWYKKVSLWEKLTPEEIGKMSKEKIEERLANMEANALLHNKKVSESDIYKELLSDYENKLKQEMEKRGDTAASLLQNLAKESDTRRDELAKTKRIKHEVTVGVLTAAMVVLPGMSQFQRVIEKNAGEWAAVTQKTKEFFGGQAAEARSSPPLGLREIHGIHETHDIAPHDARMITELKDKAVKFAIEGPGGKNAQALTIKDLEHIRNIASRSTPDGAQMKSLLQYVEKRNLLEQSGIRAVTLEGSHATPYRALEEAMRQNPEYFKGVSIDKPALDLAKHYGVTVEQLKTLSHPREIFYFSKDGSLITQNESLVSQGVINRAHEAVGRIVGAGVAAEHARSAPIHETPQSRASGAGTSVAEHGRGRAVQHVRETQPHPVRGTGEAVRERRLPGNKAMDATPEKRPPAGGKGEIVLEDANGKGVRIDISGGKVRETAVDTGKAPGVIETQKVVAPVAEAPRPGGIGTEARPGSAASGSVEAPKPPQTALKVEGSASAGQRAGVEPKLEVRIVPAEGAHGGVQEGAGKIPENVHTPTSAEIFAQGWNPAHKAEFFALAKQNPGEFATQYQKMAGGLLDKSHLNMSVDQVRSAVTDQTAGQKNIEALMKAASDYGAGRPIEPLKLNIGGSEKIFFTPAPEQPEQQSVPLQKTKIELDTHKTISATTENWKPSFDVVRNPDGSIKDISFRGRAPDTYLNQQGYGFAKTEDYIQKYEVFQGRHALSGAMRELFKDVQPLEATRITQAMEAYHVLHASNPVEAQWILDHAIRKPMHTLANIYGREYFDTSKMPESVRTALADDMKNWPRMQDIFQRVQHGEEPLGTAIMGEAKKYKPFSWKIN
ncbi:hypothetical protein HYW94_03205 [Candidatus Uhrbacteria bacterium]|nr:hypothetical protein [Candidatus Uhrbacteria bacterium]